VHSSSSPGIIPDGKEWTTATTWFDDSGETITATLIVCEKKEEECN
jgi:hypothetical protein